METARDATGIGPASAMKVYLPETLPERLSRIIEADPHERAEAAISLIDYLRIGWKGEACKIMTSFGSVLVRPKTNISEGTIHWPVHEKCKCCGRPF